MAISTPNFSDRRIEMRIYTAAQKAAKAEYDREYRRQYYQNNRIKCDAQTQQWWKEHPEACRNKYLIRAYKLTTIDWDEKFELQGRRCALCDTKIAGKLGWQTDHDHACCPGNKSCGKCVRSILCGLCNKGLGALRDSPELLRKAAAYIEQKRKERYALRVSSTSGISS